MVTIANWTRQQNGGSHERIGEWACVRYYGAWSAIHNDTESVAGVAHCVALNEPIQAGGSASGNWRKAVRKPSGPDWGKRRGAEQTRSCRRSAECCARRKRSGGGGTLQRDDRERRRRDTRRIWAREPMRPSRRVRRGAMAASDVANCAGGEWALTL